MFEIILIAILVYYVYKKFSNQASRKVKSKKSQRFHASSYPPPQAADRVIEEMKRCPACGTFNPKSYALLFQGEFFCSMECRDQRN